MKIKEFDTLSNTYQVQAGDPLGNGGVGTVLRVTDQNGNPFALKFFSMAIVSTDKLTRFRNEMDFLLRTRHDNLVPVLDTGFIKEKHKLPFYVMPIYQGTLRDLIKKGISPTKAIEYFGNMLDGVEALHLKDIWHRDLKPENILFDADSDRLRVGDLGVAHFSEDELHTLIETKHDSRMANFQYAAPEQRQKGDAVTHLADIFALGLILQEMFTGKVMHGVGHKTVADIYPDFAYLDEIISLMLQHDSANRIDSIQSVKRELIGRRNDFINFQKISQLEKTVIPSSKLDDPMVTDPMTIVDIDYEDGFLIAILNQNINADWERNFRTPEGGLRYYTQYHPSGFNLAENKIAVKAKEVDAFNIANFIKEYVPRVNDQYLRMKHQELRKNEERRRRSLQEETARKIKEGEVRKAIRKNIKL